eukprot:6815943-Pyramimonas_sp.AAC.1
MRRLTDYEGDCVGGVDLELEIAYKQLASRAAALILLHKGLKAYLDTRKSSELVATLKPFNVIRAFLKAIDRDLAPDLSAVHAHAVFVQTFIDGNSI